MLRSMLLAKLHGITVTDARVEYHGSVGIDGRIMEAAGMLPGEQVHVVNLNTGARWVTYALSLPKGPSDWGDPKAQFTLNGGGARMGVVGDRCVVMSFALTDTDQGYAGASVVFLDEDNDVLETRTDYP